MVRQLNIPIAGALTGRTGFLADLRLRALKTPNAGLIEDPETALWPLGGDLVETIGEQWKWRTELGACWSITLRAGRRKEEKGAPSRQLVSASPWVVLDGRSLGGAAAVGFQLLREGMYDRDCLVMAAVGPAGKSGEPLEDRLEAVGEEEAKLGAALEGGIRRVVLARDEKRPAGLAAKYASTGLKVEEAATVSEGRWTTSRAVRFHWKVEGPHCP